MIPKINLAYRHDIDGLRALAVTAVLLFHLGLSWAPGGYVGVDIFFVISGFLITGLIKKEIDATGRLDFRAFYMRRIRRLLPALVVVLTVTAAIAAVVLSPSHLSRFGAALAAALASVSNIFFWTEADYFDVSANVKPLLHTWSLSVEEQFYLFWPILLLFIFKRRQLWSVPVFIGLIGALSLGANLLFGTGVEGEWNENGRSTIFYLLPFRVFEFVIGALLVWAVGWRLPERWQSEILFCGGIVLMLYAVLTFDQDMLFPSYNALVPCVGAALTIYAGSTARSARVLANPLMVGLGLISYSLYLVHWPLIVFWQYLGGSGWVGQLVVAAASIALAYLSYRYVEQPFRTGRISIARPAWRNCSVAAMVSLFLLGLQIHVSDGWHWRGTISPVRLNYAGDAKSFHKEFYGGAGYPYYGPVNTEAPADIVVMGDSHGRHYAEGVYRELAKPGGWAFYNASGTSCFHLPGFTRTTAGRDWDRDCPASLNKALGFIRNAKAPVVIISHSWISQMRRGGILGADGQLADDSVTQEDVLAGILKLKDLLGSSQLVVIGNVPGTGGHNLYDILTRPVPPIFSKIDLSEYLASPPREPTLAFNQFLRDAARETGKFAFLDPHNALCENGICRNLDQQGGLIYSDTAHLSKYGSTVVIRYFLPQLRALLAARNPDSEPIVASGVRPDAGSL